jgi:selenoprotein W-related protein
LAEKILHDYFPMIEGLTLVPSGGGVFEVTLDGSLVYSRRATGSFPDPDALTSEIGAKLGA